MADDPNVMQANMGLVGNTTFLASPVGMPTVNMLAPMVRHPGEVSADIASRSQQAALNTLQVTQMTRPGALNVMMPTFAAPGVPTSSGPLSNFAEQYRANMGMMESRQVSPYYAQMVTGISGATGFNGMMPNPVTMTGPDMGIYRPLPQAPMSTVPPVPPLPMIHTPFTPALPPPRFQTPYEYAYNQGVYRGDQFASAASAAPGVAGRAGVDFIGGQLGAAVGAYAGAALGGMPGARIGGTVGLLAGAAFTDMSGLGQTAQHMVDRINPIKQLAVRSAQAQTISQDFVVSGASLSPTGRGLNQSASTSVARQIEDIAYSSRFRGEGHNQFSAQDLMRITRTAGQQGMLDMSQNPEQIRTSVAQIAKAVKVFMQIANEPNLKEAIQQMGQMRTMGLSLPETVLAATNARTFSRMSGMSVAGVTEAGGLAGAMTYQQMGLSAGLGLQMGQGALGFARQGIAAGAFSTQQIAMLGGVQGMAQREMMGSAAMLRMPMVAAALSSTRTGGTFGLDGDSVQKFKTGGININDMARMGAENLATAVSKHGVGALGTFLAQQPELQDQVGRALGPVGMKIAKMNQIMSTQKLLGLEGPGGFTTTAMAMGMDRDEARQYTNQMNSPLFHASNIRSLNIQKHEMQSMARKARLADQPGWLDRMTSSNHSIARAIGGVSRVFAGGYGAIRDGVEGTVDFMHEMGDSFGDGYVSRVNRSLLVETPEEARKVQAAQGDVHSRKKFLNWFDGVSQKGSQREAFFHSEGKGYGFNRASKWWGENFGDSNLRKAAGSGRGGMASIFNIFTAWGKDRNALEAEVEAYRETGLLHNDAKSATVDQRLEAEDTLAKALGSKQKAHDLLAGYTTELMEVSKSDFRFSGEGQVSVMQRHEEAVLRTAKRSGFSPAETKAALDNVRSVVMASYQTAEAAMPASVKDVLRAETGEGLRVSQSERFHDDIGEAFKAVAKDLGEFGSGLKDSDLKLLNTAQDSRAAMLAPLFAASSKGLGAKGVRSLLEEARKSMTSEEWYAVERQAKGILDVASSDDKALQRISEHGAKLGHSKESLQKKFKRTEVGLERVTGLISEVQLKEGATQVLDKAGTRSAQLKKNFMTGNNGAVLAMLQADPEALNNIGSAELRSIVEDYKQAGSDPTKIDAAGGRLNQFFGARGSGLSTENRQGKERSTSERQLSSLQDDAAKLQSEAADIFKEGAETFKEASEAYAKVLQGQQGTMIGPGIHLTVSR